MMRILYSIMLGVLCGTFALTSGVNAAALSITFRPGPGDYITSGDFCTTWDEIEAVVNNLGSVNLTDSAVTAAKLANNSVGNLTISTGAVTAIKLAYSDSSTWDTMPVKLYAGEYVGDSTLARRVSCGGLRPMTVEINSYSVTSSVQWVYDVRWDTTQTLAVTPTTRQFIGSALSVTRGDTQFTVTSNVETDTNVNYSGRVYLYRVWGY